MPWRIQMLLCSAAGPARRWIDREFYASSKRLPNARGLKEVSARTAATRARNTQPGAWCADSSGAGYLGPRVATTSRYLHARPSRSSAEFIVAR